MNDSIKTRIKIHDFLLLFKKFQELNTLSVHDKEYLSQITAAYTPFRNELLADGGNPEKMVALVMKAREEMSVRLMKAAVREDNRLFSACLGAINEMQNFIDNINL